MRTDALAAAATLAALLIVDPPWPFWVAWAAVAAYQVSKYLPRHAAR